MKLKSTGDTGTPPILHLEPLNSILDISTLKRICIDFTLKFWHLMTFYLFVTWNFILGIFDFCL